MTPLGSDIWHVLAPPVRLAGGARLPLASIAMRLADGSLVIYSPAAFDDAQAAELDALGPVAHLVAPSLLHHLYVAAAAARWPRATVHGAPGLAARHAGLVVHRELGRDAEPAWRDAIDVEVVGGAPGINEAVLLHRPSATLVCADLLFNITRPANLATRLLLALTGTGGGALRQSRVWRFAVKDRAVARASIDRILAWPFAQLAPVHGAPLAIDAAALAPRLARAYRGVPAPRRALDR